MISSSGRFADPTHRIATLAFFFTITLAGLVGASQLRAQSMFDAARAGDVKALTTLLDAGADIVGGCCGTTPEHIRRFVEVIDKRQTG